jgi:hypothetical protein
MPYKPDPPNKPPVDPIQSEAIPAGYIEVTTHVFKSNIARYIRMCERGEIKGVILKRYDERVGAYIPVRNKRKDA